MRISTLFFLLISLASRANSSSLYVHTFGAQTDEPIVFLHGGPGYNSASFEVSTARRLAASEFFVIVYDRRGEGRSVDQNAKFTFKESIADLSEILEEYKLTKVNLIGHSFGGVLATLFAKKHPEKVKSITLVGAPMNLQESFTTIIKSCTEIYKENEDKANLNYLDMLLEMDHSSLEYSSYCFFHAMQNGFYSTKTPNQKATELYAKMKTDTAMQQILSTMTQVPPQQFWKNEKYTTMDLNKNLKKIAANNDISVFGLYGKEDGLYSPDQIAKLEKIVGNENITYLDSCSHSVFIDRQDTFINHFKTMIK